MTGQDTNTRPGRGPVKYRIYRQRNGKYVGWVNEQQARTFLWEFVQFDTLIGCRRACKRLAKKQQREGLVESGELGA